ncbi:MAG: hypothetical protein WC375_07875 [Methanomassiliicoccales archaeon]|jgi:hypothetical protein
MDFVNVLDFALQDAGGYCDARKIIACDYSQIMDTLKHTDRPERKPLVTTRIRRSWSRCDNFLMALDCDGRENTSTAQCWLNQNHIRFYEIESSPDHSWIICDFENLIGEVTRVMSVIPGVDCQYSKHCKEKCLIVLRGHPKVSNMDYPRFPSPIISDGSVFSEWLLAFRAYWQRWEMNEIRKQMALIMNVPFHSLLQSQDIIVPPLFIGETFQDLTNTIFSLEV